MGVTSENPIRVAICQLATGGAVGSWTSWTTMMTTTTWATAKDGPKWSAGVTRGSLGVLAVPTNRSLTARRNPRGRYKTTKQIVGQNNPRTGAPHPKGQNPEGTEAILLDAELNPGQSGRCRSTQAGSRRLLETIGRTPCRKSVSPLLSLQRPSLPWRRLYIGLESPAKRY